jgi:diguanylate cyclase (GGDEF)-like protein
MMAPPDGPARTPGRLTGLLEVMGLVHDERDLGALLPAVATAVAEAMGTDIVAISLYRPAWDDFRLEAFHGPEEARAALSARTRTWAEWEPLFDPAFERHGCFLLSPGDALFVPLRHSDGHLLGIMALGEAASGHRPADDDLLVLAALAAHIARAVQDSQATAEAARYRTALEQLLRVSARLTETLSIEAIIQTVCEGISAALGFHNVSIELVDADTERTMLKAVVGWTRDEIDSAQTADVEVLRRLLAPEFEIEGCYLLPSEEGCERLGVAAPAHASSGNGRGPLAWDHHWLLIPLHDRDGRLIGVIWADEPEDRLLPSPERLVALRMFANQATTAVASAAAFEEMRFLADHDPLTRLGNRRAFTRRLADQVHRLGRYGLRFALVILDVDGFKALNDRHGHVAGDRALVAIGDVLRETLRRSDCAFRIGGDEFALVLEDVSVGETTGIVDRVGAGIAALDAGAGYLLRASFGVVLGDGEPDPEALMRAADAAMYGAKRAGTGVRFANVADAA